MPSSSLFSRFLIPVSLALGLALLALLLGKLLWLPVALVGPSPSSPAFVGVASYTPLPGRATLYCWDPLRTACRVGEGAALGSPVYRVVLEVPTALWLLAVALTVVLLACSALALAPRGLKALSAIALALLAINSTAIGSLYVDQSPIAYRLPEVGLRSVRIDLESGLFVVELDLEGFDLRSASCTLEGFGPLETSAAGGVVRARIPREYFEWLYSVRSAERPYIPPTPPASIHEIVSISCSMDLDGGRLEGRYAASFAWREPDIEVSGSRVLVSNRNPVPLEVVVTVVDKSRLLIVERSRKTIDPLGVLVVEVPGPGVYEVRISYVFLGAERARGVEVSA